jgi:hypothetical protein
MQRTRLIARAVLFASLAVGSVAVLSVGPTVGLNVAQAQQKQRTIEGTVRGASGAPVAGAIVYLKNDATLTVKTYVTTADGNYRFGQVGMDADYSVWAEQGGHKSNTKTISSFDNKQQWTIGLKFSE